MEINEFYNYTEVPGCSRYQDTFDTHKPEGIYQVESLQTNSIQPCAKACVQDGILYLFKKRKAIFNSYSMALNKVRQMLD